jgi:hypothetical protein
MKHGKKIPNHTRSEKLAQPQVFFLAKLYWRDPMMSTQILSWKKGRRYINPENEHRLRGKSALRRAKAARVTARIEAFKKEATRSQDSWAWMFAHNRRDRDTFLTKWGVTL